MDRDVIVIGERGARGLFARFERAALGLAVCALENVLQFLVLGICAACADAASGERRGRFFDGLFTKADAAVAVNMRGNFIPRDRDAAAVVAEDGGRGIIRVALGVVAKGRDDLVLILAGLIPAHGAGELSAAAGVGRDVGKVVAQRAHRRIAREYGVFPLVLRRFDGAAHVLEVGHRAADALGGHLETEVVIRLEQHIFRLHQALPHGTVRRLTEVTALGVLQMRAARDKCELHIRQR